MRNIYYEFVDKIGMRKTN